MSILPNKHSKNIKKDKFNLINKKFNKLTVIKFDGSRNNRRYWMCQCECGNKKSVSRDHLIQGQLKSCGCLAHRTGKNNPHWTGYGHISGRLWSKIKHCAKQSKRNLYISIKYVNSIFEKQNKRCALSGVEINTDITKGDIHRTASLDRIDSSKEYIKGNVQWVHKYINWMKSDHTEKEFIYWCHIISNYQNQKNSESIDYHI